MAKSELNQKRNEPLHLFSTLNNKQSMDHPLEAVRSKSYPLEDSEEIKFKVLLEAAPDAVITITEKGIINHWNKKAEEIFGWKQEEIKGRKYSESIIPKRYRKGYLKGMKNFLSASVNPFLNKQLELTALKKDQTEFPMEITISATKLENQHIFLCFIRDASERIKTQKAIVEKEEIYRTVVESLSEGLIITNIEDTIIFVNSKMEKLTGYRKNEMEGKKAYELFLSKNHPDKLIERIEKRLAGIFESYELKINCKDGSYFLGYVNAVPYRNSNGEITGTVGAITDITLTKREEELEKLAIAATKSKNSVIIADKSGKIEWVNEGFTQLSGYSLKDVIGTSGDLLRHGNKTGFSPYTNFYEIIIKDKKPVTYENKNYTKEGVEFWLITTLTPVLNKKGEVEKIIAIDSDITQRKTIEKKLIVANEIAEKSLHKSNMALNELVKAKAQLEESTHLKEQFMAQMSHEIRTPMNGVIGLTEILLQTTNLNHIQKEYLTAIKTSGSKLLSVINNILDISKMEAKKMTFEERPFKISTQLNSVLDIFYSTAKAKELEITKHIDKNVPDFLLGDTLRLNQILMNLISNAIKFTSKGQITINVNVIEESEATAWLKCSIKDTGKGIPTDKLSSIFVDFTQLSSGILRKQAGSGLGLAISKRLVELQGGSIDVESFEDTGSTFSFILPFKKCRDNEQTIDITEKNNNFSYTDLKESSILLVEDNELNQLVAERVLRDWQCNVDIAENGRIAIEKLNKKNYDLILMDIKMPEMDGYEATYYIRNKMPAPACNTKIIALTAHAATWESHKCLEAGMDDFVSKPFDAKELYKKMLQCIKS